MMNPLLELMETDSLERQHNGIRRARKDLQFFPAPFPSNDESYKDMFDIKRYNKKVNLYKDGKTKRTLYGIARYDYYKNGKKDKLITPFSYCDVAGFVNKNFYSDNSHLLYEENFPTFNPSSPRDLLWVEGEKTCDKARELFPNYLVTTASGGIGAIEKVSEESLSYLRDFRTITMWHDNSKDAQATFLEWAQELQDSFPHIVVKVVDLPKAIPSSWDLADDIPAGVSVFDILTKATPVSEYDSYNNLARDIRLDRWKYIKKQNLYYDMLTGDELPEKNVNNLYLRDHSRSGNATRELGRENIEVVAGYIFSQSKDFIVKHEGNKYINTRTNINFLPMSSEEVAALKDDPDIQRMCDHFFRMTNKDDYLYRHLLSTIASDVQHPEANRTWTVVICSWAGVGKTWAWRLFTEFNHRKNTQWLDQEEVYDKYRDWIPKCDMVIIDELRWDGREQNKFVSKMKMLVTGERHRTESKYKDAVNFYGHYKFWMSSNHFVPFDIDEEERRHHIIHVQDTWREVLADSGDPKYYEKLWGLLYLDPTRPDSMNYEFIRKAYWFFMNYKIDYSIFSLTQCPETKAKKDLKEHSWTQNERDLNELYLKKEKPFDKKCWSAESVLEKVRELKSSGNSYYNTMFNGLKTTDITLWFREKMKWNKVYNGNVLQLGNDPVRRNYWTDDPDLLGCTDLGVLRELMAGKKIDPRQNILNFEDKKDDYDRETKGIENVPF